MKLNQTIVLTGFMGSGKSAVGRKLAGRLGVSFRDLDKEIELKEQTTITNLFQTKGESYFRELERRHLNVLITGPPKVLALGGGALQQDEIFSTICRRTTLIYLDVPQEVLLRRLKKDKTRPMLRDDSGSLLSDPELKTRIAQLIEQRESTYRKADIIVTVDPKWNITETSNEVFKALTHHVPTAFA